MKDESPVDDGPDEPIGRTNKATNRGSRQSSTTLDVLGDVTPHRAMGIAGLVVFLCAALAAVIYLLAVGQKLVFEPRNEGAWAHLVSIRYLAMIAAVGVVVSTMSFANSMLVRGLSVLIVGALIIPTKDMVAFWLLMTNSDRRLADFQSLPSDGIDFQSSDSEAAFAMFSRIEDALLDPGVSALGPSQQITINNVMRKKFVALIEAGLARAREEAALDRSRLDGTLPLLIAIALSSYPEFKLRVNNDEQIATDLLALRSQGLVSFAYGDTSDIALTRHGFRVVCRDEEILTEKPSRCAELLQDGTVPRSIAEQRVYGISEGARFDVINALADCEDENRDFDQIAIGSTEQMRVGEVRQFSILSSTDIVADLVASDSDAVMTLIEVQGDANVRVCEIIAHNDDDERDSEGSFDSAIRRNLDAGTYLLVASEYHQNNVLMELSVSEDVLPSAALSTEHAN